MLVTSFRSVIAKLITPIAIAQTIARNIVPLVGILVYHWSTGNVLLLYFLDTALSMAVIFAGLASALTPPPDGEGVASWINAEAGYIIAGLFASALLCVPLGMPVGILLAGSDFSFRDALHDSSLRNGAIIQAVLALWSYVGLYRALRTHSPDELRLRRRFTLVLMRWILVVIASYAVIEILPPGDVVLLLVVVAYIAGSIAAEIAPDRFLRAMPGGEKNLKDELESTPPLADTPAGSPAADLEAMRERARQRHKR
jgi:hypothetical protein